MGCGRAHLTARRLLQPLEYTLRHLHYARRVPFPSRSGQVRFVSLRHIVVQWLEQFWLLDVLSEFFIFCRCDPAIILVPAIR